MGVPKRLPIKGNRVNLYLINRNFIYPSHIIWHPLPFSSYSWHHSIYESFKPECFGESLIIFRVIFVADKATTTFNPFQPLISFIKCRNTILATMEASSHLKISRGKKRKKERGWKNFKDKRMKGDALAVI